jgi:hypothetical protein
MARIRTIKPEFWSSEQVMECSTIARLLFIGMWNFCDDGGNHVDSEKTLKAEIFPADDISSTDVRRMIDELSANGLITLYTAQNKGFIHVNGWHHQKIDRPNPKHPPFIGDGSVPIRRTIDDQSPPEGKGREGKGKEQELSSSLRSEDSQSPGKGELPLADPSTTVRQHPASEKLFGALLESYHRRLPKGQHVSVLNPKRRKRIQAADKLARQVCREQGWPYDPTGFWDAYFAECEGDAWMRGEVPNPRNPSWKQNLDVLLAEDRFAAIMDRAIDAMRREAAA